MLFIAFQFMISVRSLEVESPFSFPANPRSLLGIGNHGFPILRERRSEVGKKESTGSPSVRCTQQSLPISEATTKAKIARGLPAESGCRRMPLAALGVAHIPVLAPRNEDVNG
jgi:hypothetical protein